MTAMMDLLGRVFTDLTVKRDLYMDGTVFHCICKCDRYRTVTREQLLSKSIKSCAYCAKQARHAANRPQVEVIPVEPPVKIELPDCIGCVVRTIRGVKFDSTNPSCPRHGLSMGYPRPKLGSIGTGRNIYTHRKAGMATE